MSWDVIQCEHSMWICWYECTWRVGQCICVRSLLCSTNSQNCRVPVDVREKLDHDNHGHWSLCVTFCFKEEEWLFSCIQLCANLYFACLIGCSSLHVGFYYSLHCHFCCLLSLQANIGSTTWNSFHKSTSSFSSLCFLNKFPPKKSETFCLQFVSQSFTFCRGSPWGRNALFVFNKIFFLRSFLDANEVYHSLSLSTLFSLSLSLFHSFPLSFHSLCWEFPFPFLCLSLSPLSLFPNFFLSLFLPPTIFLILALFPHLLTHCVSFLSKWLLNPL